MAGRLGLIMQKEKGFAETEDSTNSHHNKRKVVNNKNQRRKGNNRLKRMEMGSLSRKPANSKMLEKRKRFRKTNPSKRKVEKLRRKQLKEET